MKPANLKIGWRGLTLTFTLSIKSFSAFGFPGLPVLRLREIDTELVCDLFIRQVGVISPVVAEICEHFDLLDCSRVAILGILSLAGPCNLSGTFCGGKFVVW